jgi:uncharacterized membrane protein YgdD (TMEM256/DUF423 family)
VIELRYVWRVGLGEEMTSEQANEMVKLADSTVRHTSIQYLMIHCLSLLACIIHDII